MQKFSAVLFDYVTKVATFVRGDHIVDVMPLKLEKVDALAKVIYFPRISLVMLETPQGDTVTMQLPSPATTPVRDIRPVIYLDQKDWSLLSNVIHDPDRVSLASDRIAGERLITMARDKKVILPMSFGHIVETGKWSNGERRYRHALTLLDLSDGWQMRHPYDLRIHELRQSIQAFRNRASLPDMDVFTLASGAVQSGYNGHDLKDVTPDSTPDADAIRSITCLATYASILLESESTMPGPVAGWTQENQVFTQWLAEHVTTARDRQTILAARFLGDLQPEIMEAVRECGMHSDEFERWMAQVFQQQFASMRSISWFYAVYATKHGNRQTRWQDNDLTDLMYPVMASGHADYVVADADKASLLRQAAERRGKQLRVFASISSLMSAIEERGLSKVN